MLQALEFLTSYLSKLQVPPQTFNSPAPEFNYAIGSIVLSSVVIPPEQLIVTVSGKSVTVKASQVLPRPRSPGRRGMEGWRAERL